MTKRTSKPKKQQKQEVDELLVKFVQLFEQPQDSRELLPPVTLS